jgi:ribonuclease G
MTDESRKEEILINVTPSEVRAALLENGILQEVYIERAARRGVISNIYKGRVSRVLPGMQAAFVDIGLQRTAFLHVSDIVRPQNGDKSDEECTSREKSVGKQGCAAYDIHYIAVETPGLAAGWR